MLAEQGGRPVAGALNLRGREAALTAANWGCLGEFKFLHFETCYYQAIEYAIAQPSWRASRPAPRASTRSSAATCRCQPGAPTGSAIPDSPPRSKDFLKRERPAVEAEIRGLAEYSPFRQGPGGTCSRLISLLNFRTARILNRALAISLP